jgi:Flp pilus assembly protein TadD
MNDVNRLINEIDRLVECGRPAVAALLLEAIAVAEPGSVRIAIRRARVALAQGDCERASVHAALAVTAAPSNAEAAGLYATLLMDEGQFGRAACVLDAAILAGARATALHVALAVALFSLGEAPAAECAITRGLAFSPGDDALLRLRARSRRTGVAPG